MDKPIAQQSRREQSSILAPLEQRVLIWMADRLPGWLTPDHLTVLGFVAMAMAGFGYYLSQHDPGFLHLVNGALALNWFGDSLDGTLARRRRRERPRYGFYVDHILDSFGALLVLGGLALSGYMSGSIAVAVLIAYLMLSINSFLAAHTLGVFRISYWRMSPTELRILAIIGNLFLLRKPAVSIGGKSCLLYDLGGMVAIAIMAVLLLVSVIQNIRVLQRIEVV